MIPTKSKKTIITNHKSGNLIALAGETGNTNSNKVTLDFSKLPGIKNFKENYEGNHVHTLLEEIFKAALVSELVEGWYLLQRQEIIYFYFALREAAFELLDCVDDPQ
jgi:hypothetical protein